MVVDVVDGADAVLAVESVCDLCPDFGALDADVVAGEGEQRGCDVWNWSCGCGEEEV